MQLSHLHMRDRLIFIADGGGGDGEEDFGFATIRFTRSPPLMLCSILMILPNRK